MDEVFVSHLQWTGASQGPFRDPATFSRDLDVWMGESRRPIQMSAAASYRGNPSRTNPEQLLVSAVSACQALTYLYLAAKNGIPVVGYADDAEGRLGVVDGKIRMTRVTLHPRITLGEGADRARAHDLVEKAHANCFIANSLAARVEIEPRIERRAA
jgi:peroxiredoxin-like protein